VGRKTQIAAGLCAVAAVSAALAGTSAAGEAPTVGGCQLFPAFAGEPGSASAADQTAWNQDVSQAPKDPRSGKYMKRIRKLGGNQSLHPDFGGDGEYGIPFEVVPAGQPLVDVTPVAYGDESDFGPAPIPPGADVEGGSDHHVLVVRQGAPCELFELYRAKFMGAEEDDAWEADSTAYWDLGSAGLRPEGWTSADAAGLPILPGLVRHDEVAAGVVAHAIRATFDTTRRGYIHPATHYASSKCSRSLPPMGLRLRLRPGYYADHLGDFEPGSQARPIFEALYRYGLIVADNGSNWYFTGAADPAWDDDDVGALKDVPGRAFVVVDSQAPVTTPC
jgi:hypothetical protein